jgi:macrolide-specific efflux system membrane fusion protein
LGEETEDVSEGGGNQAVSRKLAVAVAAVATVLIAAAVVLVPHFMSSSSPGGGPELATAAISSFPVTVSASGTVVPASELPLNFATSGQVVEIDVHVGQQVSQGTVLARLDDSVARSDVAHAQAEVASSQAALNAAENPLDPGHQVQLQAALTSAQQVYDQTVAAVQATASEDAAAINADQHQINLYQQQFAADGCATQSSTTQSSTSSTTSTSSATQSSTTQASTSSTTQASTSSTTQPSTTQPSTTQPSKDSSVCRIDQQQLTSEQGTLAVDQARAQSDAASGQLRISQAQGQVAQAQAALQATSVASPSQVATAQAAVNAADAQLQAAEAELAATTLVAPISATVLAINGQVGESVTAAATNEPTLPGTSAPIPPPSGVSSASPSPPTPAGGNAFVVIGNSASYVVGVAFPASDAHELAAGQTGTMTPPTAESSIACRVLAVATVSSVVSGTPSIYVTVLPDGPAPAPPPGETLEVTIRVSQASNVLAVPISAVYMLGGQPHVDVWSGKHAIPTQVTTGVQGTSLVQITSGLDPGEQVVLAAYQGLPDTATTLVGSP